MTNCTKETACDLPNVQCAHPNCVYGRAKTPRTDALTDPEMDMDGNRLLVRYDQLARHSRQLELECNQAHECARVGADILLALVVLKAYKDAYGKTEYYEATQPAGWEIARAFLKKTMPEEYEVSLRSLDLRDGS